MLLVIFSFYFMRYSISYQFFIFVFVLFVRYVGNVNLWPTVTTTPSKLLTGLLNHWENNCTEDPIWWSWVKQRETGLDLVFLCVSRYTW